MSENKGTLYILEPKPAAADAPKVRLVRAFRDSSALKHVATETWEVRKATADDALRCAKLGVEPESALEEPTS